MLKLITALTFFLFGLLATGQETETRTVSQFSRINVKNATVIYTESDKSSLTIESEFNDTPETIQTEFSNGTLKITGNDAGPKTIVYVSGKGVTEIKGSNAKISINNQLTASNLKIVLNSNSVFHGNIEAQNETVLQVNKSASFKGMINTAKLMGNFSRNTKVILCGTAKNVSLTTRGNALCNARNFVADAITIDAGDDSNVTAYANKLIAIHVDDAAKVIYNGSPVNVEMNADAVAFKQIKDEQIVTYNY